MKILLIEDHTELAQQITDFLEGLGWQVDYSSTGATGIQLALTNLYDLIILDLGLPDIDGTEVCKQIKNDAQVNVPILMLTARDAYTDKVKGFETGADEYLTKPYDLRELALRCTVLTKRQQLYQSKTMVLGDLTIDLNGLYVIRDEQKIALNKTVFTILMILAKACPNPVSKSRIIHEVWGDSPPETDALKAHIYNLRTAIDKDFDKKLIKTIINVGYRLDIDE